MTAINLADTAKIVGLSAGRFRKVWRNWHERVAFPAPFRGGAGRAAYAWDAEDVEAWKARRKTAAGATRPPRDRPPPHFPPSDPHRGERARAALRFLRGEE